MKHDFTHQTFSQAVISSIIFLTIIITLATQNDEGFLASACSTTPTDISCSLNSYFQSLGLLGAIIIASIILFNGLYISRITIRSIGYVRNTHISTLLYILLVSTTTINYDSASPVIVSTILIIAIEKLLSIKKHRICSSPLFLATFLTSTAGAILPFAFTLIIPIIATQFIFNRLNIREVISIMIGLILPLFLASYYHWMMGDSITYYMQEVVANIGIKYQLPELHFFTSTPISKYITAATIMAIVIYALVVNIQNSERFRAKIHNSNRIFTLWFGVSTCVYILCLTANTASTSAILSLPILFIIIHLFNTLRDSIIANIILGIIAITAIINNISINI